MRWYRDPLTCLALFLLSLLLGYGVFSLLFSIEAVRKLDASGWAAWVQAIGSIGAILGAFGVAQRQSRLAALAGRIEAAERRLDAIRTLGFFARAGVRALTYLSAHLATSEHVRTRLMTGMRDLIAPIEHMQERLHGIPVFGLPHELLRSTNIITSAIDQIGFDLNALVDQNRVLGVFRYEPFAESLEQARKNVHESAEEIDALEAAAEKALNALR